MKTEYKCEKCGQVFDSADECALHEKECDFSSEVLRIRFDGKTLLLDKVYMSRYSAFKTPKMEDLMVEAYSHGVEYTMFALPERSDGALKLFRAGVGKDIRERICALKNSLLALDADDEAADRAACCSTCVHLTDECGTVSVIKTAGGVWQCSEYCKKPCK